MAQHANKNLSQAAVSPIHFDDRTALHLTQVFNQEDSLLGLLDIMRSQLSALCHAHGLSFVNQTLSIELMSGKQALHTAEYNLQVAEENLGALTVYFPKRQTEQEIQPTEDLISLAFTALRNHVALLTAAQNKPIPNREEEGLSQDEKADSLVLVALDGYQEIVTRDGDEWSQVLMNSVHGQIKEGLRQADGVYQISDELIAVLLPNTSRKQATEVAEKIRVLVSSLHLSGGVNDQLTACMGVSDAKLAATAEEVMANAKVALASAQNQGRNTIQAYDEALVDKLGIG